MGSFSNWAEAWTIRHVLGQGKTGNVLPVPNKIWIALSKADPLDDGSGLNEPGGGGTPGIPNSMGYTRAEVPTWVLASDRHAENAGPITFENPTDDWADATSKITHFALFAEFTSGDLAASSWPAGQPNGHYLIGSGALTAAKEVLAGKRPSFAAGSIDVFFDPGGWTNYITKAMLQHWFNIAPGAYTPATQHKIALGLSIDAAGIETTTPNDDGTGLAEPPTGADTGNYAQVTHPSSAELVGWSVPAVAPPLASPVAANNGGIALNQATARWGWGGYFAVFDMDTNMLYYGPLNSTIEIDIGDTPSWGNGVLTVSLT